MTTASSVLPLSVLLDDTIFREYDLRGILNKDLNEAGIQLIAKGFALLLHEKGLRSCVIGHDARSYSESVAQAFIHGLTSSGMDVTFLGTCTTPMVSFSQFHLNSPGAAMITASHNPNGWTGLKLAFQKGLTLGQPDIQYLKKLIHSQKFRSGKGSFSKQDITQAYYDDLQSRANVSSKFKIVVNTRNGTCALFAPQLFRAVGCEVIEQFCTLDTQFPNGNPNPSLQDMLEETGKKVRETHADLGFAFDGDGDRLGVVDSNGTPIYADRLTALLAQQVLLEKPYSPIVFDVKCSQALSETIVKNRGIPIMWKTGHSHIKHKAREINSPFAGERSGHFFFFDRFYGYDDAFYAGLRVLEMLSQTQKSLHELTQTLPHYYSSPVYHVTCDDRVKYQVMERMIADFKKKFPKVNTLNGARIEFDDGFALARPSSNEGVFVLVMEARTPERLAELQEILRTELLKYPELGKEWHYG